MLTALLALLWAARPARAQDDCTLPPPGSPCLLPTLQSTPALQVVGRTDAQLLVQGHGPTGAMQLQIYGAAAAGEPELRGAMDGAPGGETGAFVVAGEYLYARKSPTATLEIYSLAPAQRPTQVGAQPLAAGELAASAGALFLAPRAGALQLWSLAVPARPALVASHAQAPARALRVDGSRVLALTDGALLVYPIAAAAELGPPLSIPLTDTLAAPFGLLSHGDFVYAMGSDAAGAPRCRIVRLRPTAAAGGACPFVAGKSTLLGDYVYVNRNPTSAEYLDYEIWALGDGAAPQQVGVTPHRFAAAVAFDRFLYASSFDHRLLRLRQTTGGALTAETLGWQSATLGVNGSHRLLSNGVLFVDMGLRDGGRLVRRVAVNGPLPRVLAPDLLQAQLGAGDWIATQRHLVALTAGRLSLFDWENNALVGSYALPDGERAQAFVLSPSGAAYITTAGNLLIAVDLSNPAAPREIDRLGTPAPAVAMAFAEGHLYLFGEQQLMMLPLPALGPLPNPKLIPIEAGVREVTALPGALLVRRAADVQLLSLAAPLSPVPVPFAWGEGTPLRLLPAPGANGARAAVLVRVASGGGATHTELRVFAFAGAKARLVAAIDTGGETDLLFDGTRIVFPSLLALQLEGSRRVAAPLPPAGATFAPQPGVRYTAVAAEDAAPATVAATGADALCIEEVADLRSTDALDGGLLGSSATHAARMAVLRPRAFVCATGATLAVERFDVEVTAKIFAGFPAAWRDAAPVLDNATAWVTPPSISGSSAQGWRFSLLPGQAWTLAGPPPAPVLLPVARKE